VYYENVQIAGHIGVTIMYASSDSRQPQPGPDDELDRLITIAEAASYYGLHPDTVQKAMALYRRNPTDPRGLKCKGTRTKKRWMDERQERIAFLRRKNKS